MSIQLIVLIIVSFFNSAAVTAIIGAAGGACKEFPVSDAETSGQVVEGAVPGRTLDLRSLTWWFGAAKVL
jgi:hypothetical protein